MLPGGTLNADTLRTEPRAITFIKDFFDNDKPVVAICHAPWLLVEARVVKGHRLTSWPSLKTDVRNAGGDWVDEEVVVDHQPIGRAPCREGVCQYGSSWVVAVSLKK